MIDSGTSFAVYLYPDLNLGIYWSSSNDRRIASVGPVNGLSDIISIPEHGWDQQVAAYPGYGYVGYVYNEFYVRLYVVDWLRSYLGEITGVVLKAQYPFEPWKIEGGLELQVESIEAPASGFMAYIPIISGAGDVHVQEYPEEWCTVEVDNINKVVCLVVEENLKPEWREGRIVFTNQVSYFELFVFQESR